MSYKFILFFIFYINFFTINFFQIKTLNISNPMIVFKNI